jgi:hypothetical protein
MEYKLHARLRNWGNWLCYEAEIGPKDAKCISIESRHIPELGEVWDDPEPPQAIPDVPDAEALQELIRRLDWLEQHCLALHWGGIPAVFRHRRISDAVMVKMLANAEIMLVEMMRKSA